MDTKAKLHVGACARGGTTRGSQATQAGDHAMRPKEKVVPCGMLAVLGALWPLLFGTARETSDLLAACLPQWGDLGKERSPPMRQRVIDVDNGPQHASFRTQCMKRLGECADHHPVEIVLVSSPPSHSKYTPIERGWGIVEEHWHGT